MYDYYDDASSSLLTYVTSSTRDEPFPPSTSTTRYDPLGRLLPSTSYKFPEEFKRYLTAPSRPLVPGLTNLSTLTMEHPLVTSFLARVPSVPPAFGRVQGEGWWTKALHSWTVNDVLDLADHEGNEILLTKLQEECIFVLAALKVSFAPKHPKHFTMWGKDWATKTAERIHKLLLMKPCPITHTYNWMSPDQNLWIIEAEQVHAFPECKDGKKAANGMMLRKRKPGEVSNDPLHGISIEGVTDIRPKKRLRTSVKAKKSKNVAPSEEYNEELLEELPLPNMVVSLEQSLSDPPIPSDGESPGSPTKETKLELIGVEAPPESSVIAESLLTSLSPVELSAPTRRSARQAHRRTETVTPSSSPAKPDSAALTPISEITSLATTPNTPEESVLPEVQEERPIITRARSNSSSCSSSVTAVSNDSTFSADTVVDEEATESTKTQNGRIVGEKGAKIRASGRARKPAMKKIEADAVEEALVAEKVVITATKSAKRKRVAGKR
ncbi:hypothetical protein BDY19DRAFT_902916 [Irpex rosettiformis]|uniref:Uncharacterized protein n=1 Tax=Irpex rosettiformis TaxID=378272 RepID=A0ACB8UG27_9APHY|nr:hypothetical protein BDY19DRAFT_902916 [Irpex rosettiformis]